MRGELAPFVFYFPQPLAFFGFSPLNFLIRAKMHKSKKMTKGRRYDPILTHSVCDHNAGGPNWRGWGGGFSFGWVDIGAKKKIRKKNGFFKFSFISLSLSFFLPVLLLFIWQEAEDNLDHFLPSNPSIHCCSFGRSSSVPLIPHLHLHLHLPYFYTSSFHLLHNPLNLLWFL